MGKGDRGYWLGGGGFIKIIGGWYNLSANPPLQILSNILPGILSHILPGLWGRVYQAIALFLPQINEEGRKAIAPCKKKGDEY
ncbi:MAG: hypothetical protein EAZ09_03270 [Oscillatoriales cyanobacterium]|nr:MAG: hypothetical protein EAZ18_15900 [Oscillatoriales cyanobacterium]TAH24709.1 MAG: hypothetical protein EAZ09_03270 [Oscillatoriales cyanobacterium]